MKILLRSVFRGLSLFILLGFSGWMLAGCNALQTSEQSAHETAIRETSIQLSVEQTLMAQPVGQPPANATAPPEPVATIDTQLAAQQTIAAQQATQATMQTPLAVEVAGQTPQATASPDMESLMKSANILLYEDMISRLDTTRYVKDTLNKMGLAYEDVGSAKGWLKDRLVEGAPGGKPWDLVILAAEAKSDVSGEFFEYVSNALDQGSSVIMEVWYLDKTFNGTAAPLLKRCGVEFGSNWEKIPPSRAVMFPLDSGHPLLNQPNSGLAFTKSTSYWWDPTGKIIYDVGDLMKSTLSGDARLLLGTMPNEKTTHGSLTVCIGGRLILQTFSSHLFTYEAMKPVWENYIYNALKARFTTQQ